ncbi:MAG: hypothetical protein C4532_04385 [Candidatus Abyssobacteria bacterium SURF_17]|uniref:Uncharacterized protein n=1 Tax=Candidatus Abyssobacteria bacterium SURF_17 TaxID=2093361 RepID=A0A419F5M3_9BACT|nr:MAG: hypothetical protein C4532_04385 [Candidatus Abyssubacteria bacterium SURF_17]
MQSTKRFVLFLFAQAERMPLAEAVEFGQLLGKSGNSVRACITRLARAGLLVREHTGGRGVAYCLSPIGRTLAEDVTARFMRIHAIVEARESWDGTWTLVSFDIPERMRKRRDDFREALRQMGFGQLTGGLWVVPRDASRAASALAASLLIARMVIIALTKNVILGEAPLARSVQKIWPLAKLNRKYATMRTRMKSRIHTLRKRLGAGLVPDSREAFLEVFVLFSEAAELIGQDPCLPQELLPKGWLGLEVQDLIHEYYHMIHGPERKDAYSYLLELPKGLHIPQSRKKGRNA